MDYKPQQPNKKHKPIIFSLISKSGGTRPLDANSQPLNKRREKIQAIFTKKTIVVNNRLLTLFDEDFLKEFDALYEKQKAIQYLTKDFDPNIHVILTKDKVESIKELKIEAQVITKINESLKSLSSLEINVRYLKNLWNERYFEKELKPRNNVKKVQPKTKRVQDLVDAMMQPKNR